MEATLHDYIKCEDWFKDGGSCLKKVYRKGKGANPNAESVVKLRLKITVNDSVVVNNWGPELENRQPKDLYDAKVITDEE